MVGRRPWCRADRWPGQHLRRGEPWRCAAAERCTLLIVAHRLSTVVDADQIIVLDRGRMVACGSHDQLTRTNSLYRELATHQLLVGGEA